MVVAPPGNGKSVEVEHWSRFEQLARTGKRLLWINHPRVAGHYKRKSLLDGQPWRQWLLNQLDGPVETALELGCGHGAALAELVAGGFARTGVGLDLDASRFNEINGGNQSLSFIAGDVNDVELDEGRYDLIYALQSFHHFEALDHIMQQVNRALTPRGYFILDEYVGPPRFQWTDLQLAVTSHLLCLMPRHLRMYDHGIEKRAEGRSTPEQVIAVCPSEAIRSDEIVPAFYRHFHVVHHNELGGTIQHLLYSGIIHNFPDDAEEIDILIDSVDAIETLMIKNRVLTSDFVLLAGRKRGRE
jgi:SAM-dependent methyltransferase